MALVSDGQGCETGGLSRVSGGVQFPDQNGFSSASSRMISISALIAPCTIRNSVAVALAFAQSPALAAPVVTIDRDTRSRERQAATADSGSFDNYNRVRQFTLRDRRQRCREPRFGFLLCPVAATEQNQTRTVGLGKRNQAGEIEVCRDNHATLACCPSQDCLIRFHGKPDPGSVYGIMTLAG
jgi:hypothetical protein